MLESYELLKKFLVKSCEDIHKISTKCDDMMQK